MSTTNRGSRQSEYQRSIAGAGNVRTGGEPYGDSSRGYGQDDSARVGGRSEERMERFSERDSDYGQIAEQFGERYDELREQGRRALRGTSDRMRSTARAAQDYFAANPLMIGAVGLGIGLILGAMFPLSRREREFLEPIGENLRESAVRQGAEAVRETVSRATEELIK